MAKPISKTKTSPATVAEPETPEGRLRERVKRYLVQRFYTRFHMSLILMSAGLATMLSNWVLLRAGLHAMWLRYPITITLAYLTFIAGVWLWLQYIERTRGDEDAKEQSFVDGGDLGGVDIIPGGGGGGGSLELPNVLKGGGGSFDGGGAGGEWAEVNPVQALAANVSPSAPPSPNIFAEATKGIGDKLGGFGDLDGEAAIVIVLALVLFGSVVILSGYVIWFAPDILGEAMFGATLAGSLARTAKRHDEEGWVMGVVRKTWWPFALVLAAAEAFAIYVAIHFPGASTFGAAMHAVLYT